MCSIIGFSFIINPIIAIVCFTITSIRINITNITIIHINQFPCCVSQMISHVIIIFTHLY